jgi:hypothetical protein
MHDDFIADIRTNTDLDFKDGSSDGYYPPKDFSDWNRKALEDSFLSVKDSVNAILEIGLGNHDDSKCSTYVFLNNKKKNTFYLGIDLDDKSFFNNYENNSYTMRINSSEASAVLDYARKFGISCFDYILLDGTPSIDQCLKDWIYVDYLSDNGVVAMHKVNRHHGPQAIMNNINKKKWSVTRLCKARHDNRPLFSEDNGMCFYKKIK